MLNSIYFIITCGVLGLIIGSFLNVVIYRIPIMLHNSWQQECARFLNQSPPVIATYNLWLPRSHCPSCQTPLPFWCNLPILSYLLLGGKCHFCQAKIAWRYPVVEFLSAITTCLIAYQFGATSQAIILMILNFTLICLVFIDLAWQLLPDEMLLPILWLGLLANTQGVFISPKDAIIGATVGYLSLWSLAKVFKIIRKIDGMGHGDFKLLAVFGAWFGWQQLPMLLFIAALLGSSVGLMMICRYRKSWQTALPFGPFMALAGWLLLFFRY